LWITGGTPPAVSNQHQTDGSGFDTWHRTIDEAKEQATYQFGLAPQAWLDAAVVTDPRLLAAFKPGRS
jgi:hypothetical protein